MWPEEDDNDGNSAVTNNNALSSNISSSSSVDKTEGEDDGRDKTQLLLEIISQQRMKLEEKERLISRLTAKDEKG